MTTTALAKLAADRELTQREPIYDRNWQPDRSHLEYAFVRLADYPKIKLDELVRARAAVNLDSTRLWLTDKGDWALIKFRRGTTPQDILDLVASGAAFIEQTNASAAARQLSVQKPGGEVRP